MIFTHTNVVEQTNSQQNNKSNITIEKSGSNYEHPTGYLWGNEYTGKETLDGDLTSKGKITANNGVFTNLTADTVNADNGNIKAIKSDTIVNTDKITTKNLKVTGKAEFFELDIQKIMSSGGSVIYTPADGFKIDQIEDDGDDNFVLYWRAIDDDENEIENMWEVNDQALCMEFNKKDSNTYYWCLVVGVGSSTTLENGTDYIDAEHNKYNYIKISTIDADGEVEPIQGQSIVMCGNRTDADRQSVIYISSYDGLDSDLKAPFYAQYMGVNNFNLNNHRATYFDAESAEFVGSFKVGNKTAEEYINDKIGEDHNLQLYTYYAYSTTDGAGGAFSNVDEDIYQYIGVCVTTIEHDTFWENCGKEDFTWQHKGKITKFYQMVDLGSVYQATATVARARFYFKLILTDTDGTTINNALPSGYYLKFINGTNTTVLNNNNLSVDDNNVISWWTNNIAINASSKPEDTVSMVLYDSNDKEIDSIVVGLTTKASVIFDINQNLGSITTRITDSEGNISSLQQTSTTISAKVDSIDDGLEATGIDIENGKIEMTANDFILKSNDGINNFEADAFGNITMRGMITHPSTTIDNTNWQNYVSEVDDIWSELDIDKCGTLIFLTKNLADEDIILSFPYQHPSLSGTISNTNREKILKYLGSKVVIYNQSNGVLRLTGCLTSVNESSPTSVVVASGEVVILEPTIDFISHNNRLTEVVCWLYKVGKMIN